MTRTQAQKRNYDIYRLRGQLHLLKNTPKDLIGFSDNNQVLLTILMQKLEKAINNTRDNNRKYTYCCVEHIPNNPKGIIKVTRSSRARCNVCGASNYSSPLFYVRKDTDASTNQS